MVDPLRSIVIVRPFIVRPSRWESKRMLGVNEDERVHRRKKGHGRLGSLPLRSPEASSEREEKAGFKSNRRTQRIAALAGILIFVCWCGWQSPNTDRADKASVASAGADSRALATWTARDIERKRRRAAKSSGLDPRDEQSFDHHKLWRYFGCRELFSKAREDISADHWRYFRDLYNDYVAKQKPKTYKVSNRQDHINPVGQNVTPDKGRGLVASRDIKRGELIFTGTNNTIAFETGDAWRNFVLHLYYSPPPPTGGYEDGFACDIKSWSWIQEWPMGSGEMVIMVDIDASSLLNQPSDGEYANIQCGRLTGKGEKKDTCGVDYYAKEDIKKGDEILCNYADFAHGGWEDFGL